MAEREAAFDRVAGRRKSVSVTRCTASRRRRTAAGDDEPLELLRARRPWHAGSGRSDRRARRTDAEHAEEDELRRRAPDIDAADVDRPSGLSKLANGAIERSPKLARDHERPSDAAAPQHDRSPPSARAGAPVGKSR